MTNENGLARHWQLADDVDFLNHGSFGATPSVVLKSQRQWQDRLERDPVRFLAPERELEAKLDAVRSAVAQLVGADPNDLVFVRNATDGVNAVLRSLDLQPGDEIVITDHGYNACSNAARFVAERAGAAVHVAAIPFPISSADEVVAAVEQQLTPRTRLLLIDHVTSASGLVLPIDRVIRLARSKGVLVLVDGAHAPGMIPLDLPGLDVDFYTGNHHKWLCAPKASGFLYVRRDCQSMVRPTVISHAANRPRPNRSRFLAEFDWPGTYDPTPLLSVPAAIEFLATLRSESEHGAGMQTHRQANRRLALEARRALCRSLEVEPPSPESMIGSLATIPLPVERLRGQHPLDRLQQDLLIQHGFELPVFPGLVPGSRWLRISAQAYNHFGQYERLGDVLRSFFC